MDVDALLIESCPATFVALAEKEDFSRLPQGWVIDEAWKLEPQYTPRCLAAVVEWSAGRLTSDSDVQQWRQWLAGFAAIGQLFDGGVPNALRATLLRCPIDGELAPLFFEALIAQKVDLRHDLIARIPENWNFEALSGPDAATWHYTRYRAFWGERDAWVALDKKIAATDNANLVYAQLGSILDLKTPEAKNIIAQYRSDTRSVVGASGGRTPLGDIAEGMLRPIMWR